jgi:hypothetical protein
MATPGVDFFRVDRSGAVRRIFIPAGTFVVVGAFLIGGHLESRLSHDTAHLITLIGGLIVISGLILGFGGMAMILFENVYLLIGDSGVTCHENGKEIVIEWADLTRAAASATSGIVVFERKGGKPIRWFAGKNAELVATKVEEARMKGLHGLLKD